MNYLKTIGLCITSSFFLMNISMERSPKRPLEHYQEASTYKRLPQKKQFNLHPSLIQHGAYVASIKNDSGKNLRIAKVPLKLVSEPDESYAFLTDENNAKDMVNVSKHEHLSTDRLFFVPEKATNKISSAEGFCLLVEAENEPKTRKLLWILRSIDDEKLTCQAISYFNHEPDKKSYNTGIKKYYVDSKVITLINLIVSDPELKDIQARIKSFAVSPS